MAIVKSKVAMRVVGLYSWEYVKVNINKSSPKEDVSSLEEDYLESK
jgi:hypothetical protein